MRVSLLHNSHSGSKDHTADEVAATIRRFGHEVVGVAHSLAELGAALERSEPELIAIAGGDGTVSRTACALAGSPIPLAILPHGTANNTALALGIQNPLEEIVDSWRRARERPFDLIEFTVDGHTTYCAEAVGWGVFPQVIARARQDQGCESAPRSLDAERALFRECAEAAESRDYEVTLDGVSHSGSFCLVEICNLRFIGPQLLLSPASTPDDGRLEVILWDSARREHLDRMLEAKPDLRRVNAAASALSGERIRVRASDARRHVDGHLLELGGPAERTVEFSVRRAAVHYWVA